MAGTARFTKPEQWGHGVLSECYCETEGEAGAPLTCALQTMGSAWAELISSILLQETLNF